MEINFNLLIIFSIAFISTVFLCIKYKWDFLTSVTLNFMQDVEANYLKSGGGREKLQRVIDMLQLKFKILNYIPDKYLIKFCEYIFKKSRDKIMLISNSKQKIAIEVTNNLLEQVNSNLKGKERDKTIKVTSRLLEDVKKDYTNFIDAGLETDFKKDTRFSVKAGVKW